MYRNNWWTRFVDGVMEFVVEYIFPAVAILIMVGIFLAAVCGIGAFIYNHVHNNDDPMTSGIVVEKVYHAPYTMYVKVGTVMVPNTYPETFGLNVQGVSKKHHVRTIEVPVTHSQYDAATLGEELVLEQ